jgi:MFS family permease
VSGVDAGARAELWTRAFVLGFVANFAHSLSFHAYVHLPGHLTALGGDELTVGLMVAAMAFAAIAARPMVGRIMDRRGRRVVVIVGSVLNVLATAAYVTVDAIDAWLVLIRILHGICEAMLFSVLFTIAADVVPPSRRAEGMALFGISGMIPLSLAGWLGDVLLRHADYEALFIATAIAAAVGLVAGLWIADSRPPVQAGDAAPRSFFRAVWAPPLRPLWLLGLGFALAVASYFAFLKTYVADRGVGSVGSFFMAYSTAAIGLRLLFGKLPDRLGYQRTLVPAAMATVIAVAVLAEAQSNTAVIVAGVLGGIGHGYTFPILSALVVTRSPASERGAALATFTALFDLGLVTGGPLFGVLLDVSTYRVMFWTAAALAFSSIVGFLAWDRTR